MKACKVVVTGPFNAGKTAFIRTASDIEIVTTERRITEPNVAEIKRETTVAMDYGQRRVGDTMLHLYGTPGQNRFDFMGNILAQEMDAFILLVDGSDRGSLIDAMQNIRLFRKFSKVPYVVVVNEKPGISTLSPEEVADLLKLAESVPVMSCVATDTASVDNVLQQVVALLS
jgi:uncharacterized protein